MIADSSCPQLERKSLFNLRTDFTYCTKELGDTISAMAKKRNGYWDYYDSGESRGEAWGSPLILDQTDA